MGVLSLLGIGRDRNYYVAEDLLTKDLNGQTIIVTGGNSGFGRVICEQFAKQGAKVIIACRRREAGEAVAAEIKASGATRGTVLVMVLDLADLDSVRSFVERFNADHGSLHVSGHFAPKSQKFWPGQACSVVDRLTARDFW